jgi:hypothetical protein
MLLALALIEEIFGLPAAGNAPAGWALRLSQCENLAAVSRQDVRPFGSSNPERTDMFPPETCFSLGESVPTA